MDCSNKRSIIVLIILLILSSACLANDKAIFKFESDIAEITEFSTASGSLSADWRGLRSDSYLILSYQLAAVGIIYFLPQEISGWNDRDTETEYRFSQYSENIQDVHWDHDQWFVNYVGHPYFGAAYFVVARNRGLNKTQSFWYATTMSAVFEYGIEAFFEVPSIQDLIVTPVAGILVGEYFFQYRKKLEKQIQQKGRADWNEKALLFVTDPIGSLNRKVRKWAGKGAHLDLSPYFVNREMETVKNNYAGSFTQKYNAFGLKISFQW